MIRRPNRTLSQLLAIEMFIVALGVSFALIALTAAYYMLDKPELRRLTLGNAGTPNRRCDWTGR